MTVLTANITDSQTLIPVDAGLTNGTFQLPLYYTVDSEAIRVTGRAHRTTWLVERGIAGTTAASHSSAATLTRYYPEAATGEAGAGGVTVDNQSDPPAEVTTLIAPGAVIAGSEADLSDVIAVHRRSVTLTDAQIKALPGTDVVIVAAPGANKVILPVMALTSLRWVADYTNIDASAGLAFAPDGLTPLLESSSSVTSLLAPGDNMLARWVTKSDGPTFSEGAPIFPDGFVNQSLRMTASNGGGSPSFTGGDPANVLVVTMLYVILDA